MATISWSPGADVWTDPDSWQNGVVPEAGDTVVFDADGSLAVTLTGDGSAGEIRLSGDDSVTLAGVITLSGATVDAGPDGEAVGLLIDDPSFVGNGLTIAAGATLDGGGDAVMVGVLASGQLVIQGVLDSGDAEIGATGAGQTLVQVTGAGAAWNAAGTVTLGQVGFPFTTVDVTGDWSGGATLTAGSLDLRGAVLDVAGASPYATGTALTVLGQMSVSAWSQLSVTDAVISTGSAEIEGSVELGPNATWNGEDGITVDGGQLSVAPSSTFNVPEIMVTGGGQMTVLGPSASSGSVNIVLQNGTFAGTGYFYAPLFVYNEFTLDAGTDVIAINDGGTAELFGGIVDGASSGTLTIDSGTVALNASDSYTGGTVLQSGTLVLNVADAAGTGDIVFAAGGDATLAVVAGVANRIDGFAAGDTIELAGGSLTIDSYDGEHLVFELDGAATTLDLHGSFSAADFEIANSGGMELITTEVPCFCCGTRIRTPEGDRAVETLAIGDQVSTLLRGACPIRWIGRRSYDGRFIAGNTQILPIRIRPGALGPNRPDAELRVSPEHALFVDGVLVPAAGLVNGASIRQTETAETVEYFHIELAEHDILLANGAPAESFLDDGSRSMFHNAHEYAERDPASRPVRQAPCAPRVTQGPVLEAVRAGLAALAGAAGTSRPGRLEGYLDLATHAGIAGWAIDLDDPATPVVLEVLDRDEVIGTAVANAMRPDLLKAGIGTGRHAFEVRFDQPLSPLSEHVIRVRRAADGAEIKHSGTVLRRGVLGDPGLIADVETTLAGVVTSEAATARTPQVLDRLLQLLMTQIERVRDARARVLAGSSAFHPSAVMLSVRDAMPPMPEPGPSLDRWALVIDHAVPQVGHDGGSNAILSHCASLQRLGYRVAFLAPDHMAAGEEAADSMAALQLTLLRAPHYGSAEDVLRRHAGQFELIYLHRVSCAGRYGGLARHHNPHARLVYAVADLHHLRLARQAAVLARPDLAVRSRELRHAEFAAMREADAVITHSAVEAALIHATLPEVPVHVVPWAMTAKEVQAGEGARSGVAFLAGFGHEPNLDAVAWLLREIMPLVWKQLPELRCVLAGSDMPEALLRFGDARVEALGRVPDLATLFDTVRLSVAPLRFGAGIKAKVLDSLAAGLPCLCTGVAAEGLDFSGPLAGCLADTAEGLAAAIVALHEDDRARAAASQAGLHLIRRCHAEAEVDRLLAAAAGVRRPEKAGRRLRTACRVS